MPESEVPPTGSNPQLAGDSRPVTVTGAASTGPWPIVDKIVGTLVQANVATAVAFEAARGIIAIFRQMRSDEPLPTDAQVIEALRQRALADRDANTQWLQDHGFTD